MDGVGTGEDGSGASIGRPLAEVVHPALEPKPQSQNPENPVFRV